MEVLSPGKAPPLLMTPQMRRDALLEAGADVVQMRDFTHETAAMTPEAYAKLLLSLHPGLDTVFCGANWTFGAKGAGTPQLLRELLAGKASVEIVGYETVGGVPVSSSRIREAISSGDLAGAAAMLGRPYAVSGEIVKGKGLGKGIGYPTINVEASAPALPYGVYAVQTPLGRGIANWGEAPTAGEKAWKRPVLEIHLLGGSLEGDPLCGGNGLLKVDILKFIRPERRFGSFEELKMQIKRDIEHVEEA